MRQAHQDLRLKRRFRVGSTHSHLMCKCLGKNLRQVARLLFSSYAGPAQARSCFVPLHKQPESQSVATPLKLCTGPLPDTADC